MPWAVYISDWICHRFFSFAVCSNGSHSQKKEHEAPRTLYRVCFALSSPNTDALVVSLESPGSFQPDTARSKRHAIPMGQLRPNLSVPKTSERNCVAQESWAEEWRAGTRVCKMSTWSRTSNRWTGRAPILTLQICMSFGTGCSVTSCILSPARPWWDGDRFLSASEFISEAVLILIE